MGKKTTLDEKGLIEAINREKKIIADARDRLRDLLDDATSIADTADDAIEQLNYAVEQLSQYL